MPVQVLDAVVCDPPYGVRAGGRKSHSKPGLQVRDRAAHITSTAPYSLGACPHRHHPHSLLLPLLLFCLTGCSEDARLLDLRHMHSEESQWGGDLRPYDGHQRKAFPVLNPKDNP